MLLARHDHRKIVVTEGVRNVGLLRDREHLRPAEPDLAAEAAECIRQLEQHPLDTEARERLAVIYADHYGRLDMAAGEPRPPMPKISTTAKIRSIGETGQPASDDGRSHRRSPDPAMRSFVNDESCGGPENTSNRRSSILSSVADRRALPMNRFTAASSRPLLPVKSWGMIRLRLLWHSD